MTLELIETQVMEAGGAEVDVAFSDPKCFLRRAKGHNYPAFLIDIARFDVEEVVARAAT